MEVLNFEKAYKYGYDIEKIVPQNIDMQVVMEWTEDQKIIYFKQNENNFLLACIDDREGEENIIYSFMRFFALGNTTQCSVDFQSSSIKEMIANITYLLAKKHTH